MRNYLHGVLQHMMVIHMETLSLSKSFRRQILTDLLSPILFQIRHSCSYPSHQAEIEYAVLRRVINGKDDDDEIKAEETFDDATEATENSTASSLPSQSSSVLDTASVSSRSSKVLVKEKSKNKSLFKKSESADSEKAKAKLKSKKKKSKKTEQETVWVARTRTSSIPNSSSSLASQPSSSRKMTISTHRLGDFSNYRMLPETSTHFAVDLSIKEDYEKALATIGMVLECLDADC